MENVLSVNHVKKYYGNKINKTVAVNDISFGVRRGEFVGVMGASGSGKTTLLNCISTIDRVSSGTIAIDGQDITQLKGEGLNRFRREQLGFIFQDFNLLDTLTAFENIALSLTIQKVDAKAIQARVNSIATRLNIEPILEKYPYQLSGGEKQRVAAARAIVSSPALILADEPTGSLDSQSARLLLNSLQELNESLQATILMVTHDAFTASFCDRIIFIKDGRIFHEHARGDAGRKQFFKEIIEVVTALGGDLSDAI